MTPNEPSSPNDDPGPVSENDALRRLEERLDRASDAAERLISEAARAAASARARAGGSEAGTSDETAAGGAGEPEAAARGAGETSREQAGSAKPPPAGWQLPRSEGADSARNPEVELLANVLQSFRDLIPPELQERLATALRELLLALRALIDWYIERMERRRAQPVEVEDIPIL